MTNTRPIKRTTDIYEQAAYNSTETLSCKLDTSITRPAGIKIIRKTECGTSMDNNVLNVTECMSRISSL